MANTFTQIHIRFKGYLLLAVFLQRFIISKKSKTNIPCPNTKTIEYDNRYIFHDIERDASHRDAACVVENHSTERKIPNGMNCAGYNAIMPILP